MTFGGKPQRGTGLIESTSCGVDGFVSGPHAPRSVQLRLSKLTISVIADGHPRLIEFFSSFFSSWPSSTEKREVCYRVGRSSQNSIKQHISDKQASS